MPSWTDFAQQAPQFAALGRSRFQSGAANLTIEFAFMNSCMDGKANPCLLAGARMM